MEWPKTFNELTGMKNPNTIIIFSCNIYTVRWTVYSINHPFHASGLIIVLL